MNSIIQQIHHEASTSEQVLLERADAILSNAKDETFLNKVSELQELGFTQFQEARELQPKEIERVKAIQQHIANYRALSDKYKFMTDEAVTELCRKFGLVQAPVNTYKAGIPIKNQNDIIEFAKFEPVKPYLQSLWLGTLDVTEFSINLNDKKLKWNFPQMMNEAKLSEKKAWAPIVEIIKHWDSYTETTGWMTRGMTGIFEKEGGKLTKEVVEKYASMFVSAMKVMLHQGILSASDFEEFTKGEGEIAKQDLGMHPILLEAVGRVRKGIKERRMEFRIVAPLHMLNMDGHEVNENFKVVPIGMKLEAPRVKEWFRQDDPIVQVKVDGGWLNITAWGDEADLPIIV